MQLGADCNQSRDERQDDSERTAEDADGLAKKRGLAAHSRQRGADKRDVLDEVSDDAEKTRAADSGDEGTDDGDCGKDAVGEAREGVSVEHFGYLAEGIDNLRRDGVGDQVSPLLENGGQLRGHGIHQRDGGVEDVAQAVQDGGHGLLAETAESGLDVSHRSPERSASGLCRAAEILLHGGCEVLEVDLAGGHHLLGFLGGDAVVLG